MKLYDVEVSGNGYKARLLLSMLGRKYESVTVNLMAGEQKKPEFLKLNPRGQVPVLDDDGVVIWDSQAILVYLARAYGGEKWLPIDAKGMAEVMQWMAVSENECLYGLGKARIIKKFGRPGDLASAEAMGESILKVMNAHLQSRDWLALSRPTIADIACYPYVALAHEGGFSFAPYPAVSKWVTRFQTLPGYVGMPGIA